MILRVLFGDDARDDVGGALPAEETAIEAPRREEVRAPAHFNSSKLDLLYSFLTHTSTHQDKIRFVHPAASGLHNSLYLPHTDTRLSQDESEVEEKACSPAEA